jgi:hypothetical protein
MLAGLALPVVAEPEFAAWSHTTEVSHSGPEDTDYLLGLGALQKIGGRWRHKKSEALQGSLERITWQVIDGFTAEEGFAYLRAQLPPEAELLFECDGRSCGSSAQWADRVFHQRLLYGHDERQHYAVWRISEGTNTWTVVLYAVDRANRRHYLQLDLLRHTPGG